MNNTSVATILGSKTVYMKLGNAGLILATACTFFNNLAMNISVLGGSRRRYFRNSSEAPGEKA